MAPVPQFPERHHPTVAALSGYSDLELLAAFQQHPDSGRYFVALFCRYSSLLYALATRGANEPAQVDYLFALSWRHIFYELRGLDIYQLETTNQQSLRSWLVEMVGFCSRNVRLPPVDAITYDLKATPPPLWCHIEGALDALAPQERLVLLLTQSAGWSLERVAERITDAETEMKLPTVTELEVSLQAAYQALERSLPSDLQEIYLAPTL